MGDFDYWSHLVLDKDWWWALMSHVVNLQFHKCREFFDQLSKYLLLVKGSFPWNI
jgi:hypothetical protein